MSHGTERPESQDRRTTFAPAMAGYDSAFRRVLAAKIITTIADVLVTVLAMVPSMDLPAELQMAVDALAARVRREVARGRAEGIADILGASGVEGHA